MLAVTGWLVGDLGFLYLDVHDAYASGNLVDAGWLLGSLCFALAALHPSMSAVTDARASSRPRSPAAGLSCWPWLH